MMSRGIKVNFLHDMYSSDSSTTGRFQQKFLNQAKRTDEAMLTFVLCLPTFRFDKSAQLFPSLRQMQVCSCRFLQ